MAETMSFNRFLLTFFSRPGAKQPVAVPERRPHLSHEEMSPFGALNNEHDLAANFAALVNSPRKNQPNLCPGFTIALGRGRWDPNEDAPAKIDAALYPADDTPADGRPHWEKQRLLIEFTVAGPAADPFDDLDWSAKARKRADRYIAHALARQQRTALYTLLVNGPTVRLARWDRSGIIYTEAVDYVESDPTALRDILWAFSSLSAETQGVDPTATPLRCTSPEYQLMNDLAGAQETDIPEDEGAVVQLPKANKRNPRVFAHARRMFAESLQEDWPRWKLLVPTKNGKSRTFLVAKPSSVMPGAMGRATRCYVALDVEEARFVFLKDTWLPQSEEAGVMLEGDTLKKLRQVGVRNIPTMVCHGEVGHEAQAPRHWGSRPGYTRSYVSYDGVTGDMKRGGSSAGSVVTSHSEGASASYGSGDYGRRQPLRRMRHYRLVVEDVCMPLECFTNGRQLISVVKDCVDAHRDAYATRSRILHRDIGFKSIQILPKLAKIKNGTYKVEWRGTLTDWELAKSMPYIGELHDRRSRRPTRMGTSHAFAAAHALDNPYLPAQVEDELESFFHIIHYSCLRYLRHSCIEVHQTIADYFGPEPHDSSEPDEHAQYPYTLPRCQPAKREAARKGILHNSRIPYWHVSTSSDSESPAALKVYGAAEFYVVDADGLPQKHPLNKVFWTMSPWLSARYEAIEERIPPALREPLARKLETHEPFRALLDKVVSMEWPEDDRVGDQLDVDMAMGWEDESGEDESEAQKHTEPLNPVLSVREAPSEMSSVEEPPSKRVRRDPPEKKKSLRSFMRTLGLPRRGRGAA
ncbi:hypothetical protein C2E23DRAFT_927646 [Lenzites betulinus]|nr:hypothetical protein C2E23DRAFT_927646 [Lenzites betulinus]